MRLGLPKEIKNREHRVALTPEGVRELTARGHQVCVQAGAGEGSGFTDDGYADAGAQLVADAAGAWDAELVVKVKEPLPEEYAFLRPGQILFTFLHLAAAPELAAELMRRKVCAIGYETVQLDDGSLPLLAPMSQVAGRMAVQLGVRFLQRENATPFQGMGRLAGGIAGVPAIRTVILGGGNVGRHAAASVAGLGADVTILEANGDRIAGLAKAFPAIDVRLYGHDSLIGLLPGCQLLIGAALLPGARAPRLLRAAEIGLMPDRAVFIDVAIDQGGISETSRPTTYTEPVYPESGVLHCCLPNLPAAVPETSTRALTTATFPYVMRLADDGLEKALSSTPELACGVNIRDGLIVHPALAGSLQAGTQG